MSGTRHRRSTIIAFSIAHERDELLTRGLGIEHVKELLMRLARPLVRDGRSIAYAGGWKEREDNFTDVLLRLITAEQDDISADPDELPDDPREIAPLINHLAWPHYLEVTPRMEAEWINSCRILRVPQDPTLVEVCPDAEAAFGSERAVLSAAVTLSQMRKLQVAGMTVQHVREQREESIPGIAARIVLGGKLSDFSGFLPGVFEEALLALREKKPLFVLGGFGGAAGALASAFLSKGAALDAFDVASLERGSPGLVRLNALAAAKLPPAVVDTTAAMMSELRNLALASASPCTTFATGLDDPQTKTLMETTDIDTAVKLTMSAVKKLAR